jgi:hypothetical protein
MILLAIAVLCWIGSIASGLRNRAYVLSTLWGNINILQMQAGHDPEVGRNPQYIAAATAGGMSGLQKNVKKASLYWTLQFRLLLAGGVFFLAWHIVDMFAVAKPIGA